MVEASTARLVVVSARISSRARLRGDHGEHNDVAVRSWMRSGADEAFEVTAGAGEPRSFSGDGRRSASSRRRRTAARRERFRWFGVRRCGAALRRRETASDGDLLGFRRDAGGRARTRGRRGRGDRARRAAVSTVENETRSRRSSSVIAGSSMMRRHRFVQTRRQLERVEVVCARASGWTMV